MIEREIEIKMPSGMADAAYFAAERNEKLPGILFLTDIRGIRESHRERARRLAGIGYTVLMPNVFYRTRQPPIFDFELKWGEPRTMQRIGDLTQPLTPAAMVDDARHYFDALHEQAETLPGEVGIVGHCFTGAMALRIAVAYPKEVAAMASFHGGNLYTDKPDSPHLGVSSKTGTMLFEHAENDSSMSAETIVKFEQAMADSDAVFTSKTISGAKHGWTVSDHATYDAAKSEEAFRDMKALFAAEL
jgi:carboxymethylenebutenolidase